jgi:biopolymer transport protein ExbB
VAELLEGVKGVFRAGGLVMWTLLGTSLVIWFLMAWWWWSLLREWRSLGGVADDAVRAFRAGGRKACLAALSRRRSLFAEALAQFVGAPQRPGSRAELDAVLAVAQDRLAGPGAYLRVLVRIAPLLGLLGTVYGMVETFDVLNVAGPTEPKALSRGISCALLTTQAGLLIALPGLYGHDWLRGWEERIGVKLNQVRVTLAGLVE